MAGQTPSLREQGKQALTQGNFDQAVDLLARSVMLDDNDLEAKALLGIAYSQKGLHAQAKRALQTAAERDPQNVGYRYNLGVVCERAGDMMGAAVAFRDTLQLNPQHAQARAKLQAIPNVQQLLAAAPKQTGPVGVPTYKPGEESSAPPPPGYGSPSAPPAYAPPAAPSAPPPPTSSYMSPGDAPPGKIQCPQCGQFSQIGLACEFCSGPLPTPQPPASMSPAPYARPTGGPPIMPMMKSSHRGGTILTWGILAILCNYLFIPGIMAITQGGQDLEAMDAGIMDDSGRGMTQAGRILGIVGTCLSALGVIVQLINMSRIMGNQ